MNDFKLVPWEMGLTELEEDIAWSAYGYLCMACEHDCNERGCDTIQRIKSRLKGVLS